MASAQVVVSDANEDTAAVGGIFSGISFFLVQRVPSRSTFVDKIHANGGRVVRLENQADHIVADHLRKDSPTGSISYTFIERAIEKGKLPDPKDHKAGPALGTIREAGSAIPGKTTRTPFTADDDRVLWQWVERLKRQGGMVKGNEIYKQLEAKNPRHTYQAWRDRYIKKLMDKPPAGVEVTVAANAPPSPPTAQDQQDELTAEAEPDFTEDEHALLLGLAQDIEDIVEDRKEEAWEMWSSERPHHSAQSWQAYYEAEVRPVYQQQLRAEMNAANKRARGERDRARSKSTTPNNTSQANALQDQPLEVLPARQGTPSSQKRKRNDERPPSQDSTGRKRLRSEQSNLSEQDAIDTDQPTEQHGSKLRNAGAASTQPIELLSSDEEEERRDGDHSMPTSELNQAVQRQLDGELQAGSIEMPKSELNRQARAQSQNEGGNNESQANVGGLSTSNLPTSKLSLLSGGQTLEDSFDIVHDAVDVEGSLPGTRSLEANPDEKLEANGKLLTEANLASQQAQHKAKILRGADLPEDGDADNDESQNQFTKYLQDLVKSSRQPNFEPINTDTQNSSQFGDMRSTEVQPESQGVPLGLDDYQLPPIRDLPMSSQQEIDDAFEEAINWPESPKVSQKMNMQPHSMQFETQIAYPKLPSQEPDISQLEADGMVFSPPTIHPQVQYPILPEELEANVLPLSTESQPDSLDDDRARRSESPGLERESSYVVVDDEQERLPSQEVIDGEIDLSIPEPEGGWDHLSSPRHVEQLVDVAALSHRGSLEEHGFDNNRVQRANGDRTLLERLVARGQPVEIDDAVVVSSDSTSSSSESSAEVDGRHHGGPQMIVVETQDILNAETQQPDLEMPSPPESDEELEVQPMESDESGIFVAPSLEELLSSRGRSSANKWTRAEDRLLLRGTRDGLTATQMVKMYGIDRTSSAVRNRRQLLQRHFPNGEIPKANVHYQSDESRDEELPSDPLEQPSSPLAKLSSPVNFATSESQRNLPNIQKIPDEDIDSYVDKKVVFGFKEASIIDALKCTSMRPDLADLVLLEEKSGKGLPVDVAGIWSEEEDRTLESGNARGLRKLEEKHTWKECEERMQFLQDWREEEEE